MLSDDVALTLFTRIFANIHGFGCKLSVEITNHDPAQTAYGTASLLRQYKGLDESPSLATHDYSEHLAPTVLAGIRASGASLGCLDLGYTFRTPESWARYKQPLAWGAALPYWANLKILKIGLAHDVDLDLSHPFLRQCPLAPMTAMLANLEELYIRHGSRSTRRTTYYVGPTHIFGINLPASRLRRLELEHLQCTELELDSLLRKHCKTLQELKLVHVALRTSQDWRSILSGVFRDLNLENLDVSELTKCDNIGFGPLSLGILGGITISRWRGRDAVVEGISSLIANSAYYANFDGDGKVIEAAENAFGQSKCYC